jgi:hypothetical protein
MASLSLYVGRLNCFLSSTGIKVFCFEAAGKKFSLEETKMIFLKYKALV